MSKSHHLFREASRRALPGRLGVELLFLTRPLCTPPGEGAPPPSPRPRPPPPLPPPAAQKQGVFDNGRLL